MEECGHNYVDYLLMHSFFWGASFIQFLFCNHYLYKVEYGDDDSIGGASGNDNNVVGSHPSMLQDHAR